VTSDALSFAPLVNSDVQIACLSAVAWRDVTAGPAAVNQ